MANPDPKRLPAARRRLANVGVEVLLEDNHLLVVVKPAGLLSQGDGSSLPHLADVLSAYRSEVEDKPGPSYVGLVHRLDRNVSGVVLTAKTSKAAGRLARLFRERDPALEKHYLAWVAGVPDATRGELRSRLLRMGRTTRVADDDDGAEGPVREAHLHWLRRARGPEAARLEVRLETGVTHQIRAQLAGAGHALHGDSKYGGPPWKRIALHAWRLAFPHPVGGARLEVTAPVPRDLLSLDTHLALQPPVDAQAG
jgi:23S rRNA pseudouridine1911/1915/1917 synthase